MDVGILRSYVVGETGEPGKKTLTMDRQPLPFHMLQLDLIPGHIGGKRVC